VLQYLADQSPDAGLAPPNGTLARVRLQETLNFVSSELHKSFSPFFSGKELNDEQRQRVEAGVHRRAAYIEKRLADGRDFLLGDTFTVADAYAFVVLNWAGFIGLSLDAHPKTQAYVARIAARPAAIKAMVAEGLMEQAA
jgi:glutathione S-transferase